MLGALTLSEIAAGMSCTAKFYGSDCAEIKFGYHGVKLPGGCGGDRKAIKTLSRDAAIRMAFEFAKYGNQFRFMHTLTMPPEAVRNGACLKAALNVYLQKLRRAGAGYAWFLEFQKNGSPHFHLFSTLKVWFSHSELSQYWAGVYGTKCAEEPKSKKWKKDELSKKTLRNMCAASGRLDTLRAAGGAWKYAVKYAAKAEQKEVPEGFESVGRFWGIGGNVKKLEPEIFATSGAAAARIWKSCRNETKEGFSYVRRRHMGESAESLRMWTRGKGNLE